MLRKRKREISLLWMCLLSLACASDPARESDRAYQGGLAVVSSIDVHVLPGGSGGIVASAVAIVRGHLPDVCTEIDEIDQSSLGTRIELRITTRRPFGAVCAQQIVPWERSVQIPGLARGGLYSVVANGVSTSVTVMQGPFD